MESGTAATTSPEGHPWPSHSRSLCWGCEPNLCRSAAVTRATQRGEILELLIAARGDWVPLPRITDCAAQYNARIFELRRLGFRIANRTKLVNGTKHSWFRLEPQTAPCASPEARKSEQAATNASFPQFGSLARERYG